MHIENLRQAVAKIRENVRSYDTDPNPETLSAYTVDVDQAAVRVLLAAVQPLVEEAYILEVFNQARHEDIELELPGLARDLLYGLEKLGWTRPVVPKAETSVTLTNLPNDRCTEWLNAKERVGQCEKIPNGHDGKHYAKGYGSWVE
jgi:hypothetical protein